MFGKGFAKYLRRSPLSDDELITALTWIRDEVNAIINGDDSLPIPDVPPSAVLIAHTGHGDGLPVLAGLPAFMPNVDDLASVLDDAASA